MTLARANPSTFSALAMGALVAAAKELGDEADVGFDAGLRAARAAADSIATRGKSAVGDKTVLDALVPSIDAAAATPDAPLPAAIAAAREGVERTRELVSQRGRAAWVGERTAGHADGGATAWVRVLEAIAAELDAGRAVRRPRADRLVLARYQQRSSSADDVRTTPPIAPVPRSVMRLARA